MKKLIIFCLILCMTLGFSGCSDVPEETAPETRATAAPVEPTAAAETEAPQEEKKLLYFTVSELTFTLVGETENIYVGSAPLEEIVWESGDESVVTVEDGVLTAVGVGDTTVTAFYQDQTLSCKVGCLAGDEEELKTVPMSTLRTHKRVPPVVEDEPCPFYQDAALVGDSISFILFQNETRVGYLGRPLFLAKGGISVNSLVKQYGLIFYQGHESTLEDAVAQSGVKKIVVMLGQNDLGYMSVEETMENLDILLNRVLEQSPQVEIHLQSCTPEWCDNVRYTTRNDKIVEYNQALKEYAGEHGYGFVDIYPYIVNHYGSMASAYTLGDQIHLNMDGCMVWMQALKAYAHVQAMKGV